VSGGTDNHLMLVDLRPKDVTGKARRGGARARLAHLQQERHPLRPREALRHLRHPARHAGGTTRGFGVAEFREIGKLIAEVVDGWTRPAD
jgi:glycine hydroxymethyltransferase